MTASPLRLPLFSLALALAPALAFAQHDHAAPASAPAPAATLLPDLGGHGHPIATSSPEAQKFFDQGLTLLFGFNHEEAIRSFERAAALDPKAAMPHWGAALAHGSNYNDPQPAEERLKKAFAESRRAVELSASGPEIERDYAAALAKRYAEDPKAEPAPLLRAYHEAMGELSRKYPDDLDAATLWAESGMNLNPWKLWRPDGSPAEGTLEVVATLEGVLKRDPNHPGANHYYIHAVEASAAPERALPSAARLPSLVPGAGHLVHMPAHIYMRTGDYLAAERINARAADVDRAYIRATGANGLYPLAYYNHNVHFQSAAAAMAGRYAESRKAAEILYDGVLPAVPDMQMLEGFLLQPLFVDARFRKWEEIDKIPDPGAKLPLLRAARRYARGLAAAARKDGRGADTERKAFASARAALPAEATVGMLNPASDVLEVAAAVLDARIAQARGDRAAAIDAFGRAVAAEDKLAYDEPPTWYYPVRESLGAALLADGRAADAEKVFREDLDRNPRNPRSLFGLAESLAAQKKTADAAAVRARFEAAWKDADSKLTIDGM
jgi:tetratricopeptide (TPR) repeat protein